MKQDEMRALVETLTRTPSDFASAQVLADRCEELGFSEAALGFRSDPGSPPWLKARAGLRLLFGDGASSEGARASYTAVLGLPRVAIGSLETETLETTPSIFMILKRLYISRLIAPSLLISQVRVGNTLLLVGPNAVDGTLFDPDGPDLFDALVYPGQRVEVVVENRSDAYLDVAIAVLGLDGEKEAMKRREFRSQLPAVYQKGFKS